MAIEEDAFTRAARTVADYCQSYIEQKLEPLQQRIAALTIRMNRLEHRGELTAEDEAHCEQVIADAALGRMVRNMRLGQRLWYYNTPRGPVWQVDEWAESLTPDAALMAAGIRE